MLLLFLPDTPRWYYAQGRFEEGDAILARLHDLSVDHPTVEAQRADIIKSIEDEASVKFSLAQLLWDNSDLRIGRRLRTSFLILFIQQFLGINMLIYYSTQVFLQIGMGDQMASIMAAVMNTVFALSCYPTGWFIEKLGRRSMMIWCGIGCGVGLLIYVSIQTLDHKTVAMSWGSIGAVLFYDIMFGFGWVGPPWMYGPEIAPVRYRHIAGGLASCGEWLSTWITVFAGGVGIDTVGPKIFIWPLLSSFLAAAYVYFLCPETTGLTLEEIDYLFATDEAKEIMNLQASRNQMGHVTELMALDAEEKVVFSEKE